MQSMKETASNVAASARAGMEKAKATMEEKAEKMTTRDPVQKEMATQKKEDRINQAELEKREAREHNAAARGAAKVGAGHPGYTAKGAGGYTEGSMGSATHSTTGQLGHGTGAHQMSALQGHGTGQPTGPVTEGSAATHPIGTDTGAGRTTAHNTNVAGGTTGYKTGGGYSG